MSQLIVLSALKSTYMVVLASNLEEARIQLVEHEFSLIILDIMLTHGACFEICDQINSPGI
jgi:DNA-binding response OmpR family regulator